jgi:hypothetical protein
MNYAVLCKTLLQTLRLHGCEYVALPSSWQLSASFRPGAIWSRISRCGDREPKATMAPQPPLKPS